MQSDDLKELLLSIAEEDAIISILYAIFIKNKGYTVSIVEEIIRYGISIGWFELIEVNTGCKLDTEIEWNLNNHVQEILFCDMDFAVKYIFNDLDEVPGAFRQFIKVDN